MSVSVEKETSSHPNFVCVCMEKDTEGEGEEEGEGKSEVNDEQCLKFKPRLDLGLSDRGEGWR